MKTNIENHIKSQLDNREIKASENAWDRLNEMLTDEKTSPNRTLKLWLPISIAASTIIGMFWWMNSPSSIPLEHNQQNSIVDISQSIQSIPETEKVAKEEINQEIIPSKEIEIPFKNHSNNTTEIVVQKPMNDKVENQVDPMEHTSPVLDFPIEFEENDEPIEWVQIENSIEKEMKTNYANPDMLLYSIEHNQTIQEVENSQSRMVIVDFNK